MKYFLKFIIKRFFRKALDKFGHSISEEEANKAIDKQIRPISNGELNG